METIPKICERKANIDHCNARKRNLEKIKEKLKQLQELKLGTQLQTNEVTQELHRTVNQVLENLEENNPLMAKIQNLQDNMIDRIVTKPGNLPEKYFMARNSLLTDLAELPHLRTMRSIFFVVLLSLLANATTKDLVKQGKITLGFNQFLDGLTNFHMALFIWICMFVSTIVVYGAFLLWGIVRVKLMIGNLSLKLKLWDAFWLLSFVIYCFGFLYFTIAAIIANSLQIIVSKLVIAEMIRLLMKTYAFVRSNAPRVLKYKFHDEEKILCPDFSKYLYFSFAPTLIYRDSYPRTTHIRWNYVALCFAQIFAAGLGMHLIQEYVVVYSFEDYDLKTITWQEVVLLMSKNGIPGMFFFICSLFIVCHGLQNAFAEMLRFADRLFYKDWWNSTSIEEILKTWNVIVHDWFYTYVYKDMYEIVAPKNKTAAKIMEYFISLCFHEFIYGFPYRFYYSIMFFIYIFGVPLLSFLKFESDLITNTLILHALTNGLGILRTGLMLEYYIRIECPVENATIASYFIPRTFTCT